MRSYLTSYRCTQCGKEFETDKLHYLCDDCSRDYVPGMPLLGVLEAMFDYATIAKAWKEKPDPLLFSAVAPEFYPPLPVGATPFFKVERLSECLFGDWIPACAGMTNGEKGMTNESSPSPQHSNTPELQHSSTPTLQHSRTPAPQHPLTPNLWIKNEALNPSGSYKDRASQLVVADAVQKGIHEIVAASTGNAASSLACIAASVGKKAVIFAPESAPPAKLIQIQVHGAELHKVNGTYDDAFKAALNYSAMHECLCRNTGYHPLTVDGKKSAGLELFIQNDFTVPDWIVIPVGDGVIITGIYKAFVDLQRAGIISELPKLLCVQAESSDAITSYWESGKYCDAANPATIADSISVKTPALAHWAVEAIHKTKGKAIRVSDTEIQQAQLNLARLAGVFAEPSSAATLAGVEKAWQNGWITKTAKSSPESRIVLLITGHGLKDPAAVKL
ncbi:MAG: threonine synthase [Candidatus Cloacimonetes bacterium]|nr:threonine synthase [Candidatus Cloacimonadota bacterium]